MPMSPVCRHPAESIALIPPHSDPRNPLGDSADDFIVDGPKLLGQLIGCYFRRALATDNDDFITDHDLST